MLYELVEPFATGLLDVGDGNHVYWETSGNPAGKPAILIHGGPGQGSAPGMRRCFDPERYCAVLFDQRGCGRSTPNAGDPATDLTVNTTGHLVGDLERLREHLGFERWLVCGASWGSTLGLAYAQEHPDRVTEIVLSAITTSRRSETDWLYRGAAIFFPEAFERFRAAVPDARDDRGLLAAYTEVLKSSELQVRAKAARAWSAWETAVLSLEPGAAGRSFGGDGPVEDLIAMVRLCAWYGMNGAFLEEGELLAGAGKLAGITGVLIHGRLDLSCPVGTAWELAGAWPDARLLVDDYSGHRGSAVKRQWLLAALDGFAA
jgi:proline iminopeptidase